jgi:branched-chain amino acid aminotransferase
VTRKSVIQIAKDWGIDVQERQLSVKELVNGILDGSVTEAFGAGTAAVIAPIQTIGFDGVDYQLPGKKESDFSSKVFTEINQIRLGQIKDTRGWVWKV